MTRNILKFAIPGLLLLLVGCRTPVPVYNVTSAPVTTNKPVSLAEVRNAIVRAGVNLGWQMIDRGPGNMEGTLTLREHRANVNIKYDAKAYSITYKDSEKLNYDGTNIHSNYNAWIQNLDRAIRVQLSAL